MVSFTLRKEHRLNTCDKTVQRNIFGPKRDEVTGEWRRLHKEELYGLYSPNIFWVIKSRRMGGTGHVALKRDKRGA
jgi:hypothetical protein